MTPRSPGPFASMQQARLCKARVGVAPSTLSGPRSLAAVPGVLQISRAGYFNRLPGTGLSSSDPNPSVLAAGRAASVPDGLCPLPPVCLPPTPPGLRPLPQHPGRMGGFLRLLP